MSRGRFRTTVDEPRPTSAWVLVTVASASLWITHQLDAWAMVVQVIALIGSLWRRLTPFAWQRSPVALNFGMAGIVVATIVVALRGEPSTIALAHFAALTQGLQLVDTRPRHTEFLLVALALFQVVLASNLTDSVFFTPLLGAFVLATVWTLLVHTLHCEATEAGDQAGIPRAITPGLLRVTLLASGLSVALALILFVSLPRLRSSVVTGSRLGAALGTAGFSNRVELGDLGRIRQDTTIVLRVETLEGEPPSFDSAYWRGLAFDTFDGRSWSIVPPLHHMVPGSAESGVSFGRSDDPVNLVQRIVREPVDSGVIFSVGAVRRMRGTVRRLERDTSGGFYAAGQDDERVRYTVASFSRRRSPDDLQRQASSSPRRETSRYLQIPEALRPTVARLSEKIAREATTDAQRTASIERYLVENGRYTDVPPVIERDAEQSPVEVFLLGEMAGHCEYFASSMVLLARSLGLHTRLVNGFAGGHENRIGGFVELTGSDAHTWVEVHFERSGWVRFDPTPPDLRARPAAPATLAVRLHELSSAVELWWFRRVVGFDRSDQIHAVQRAWLAWKRTKSPRKEVRSRSALARLRFDGELPWREIVACISALAILSALVWRRRRAREPLRVPRAYAEALRLLARRGLERPANATALDFARIVRARQPEAAATAFDGITRRYLGERFGDRAPSEGRAELAALRRGLGRRAA